jgi:hypothetical protein
MPKKGARRAPTAAAAHGAAHGREYIDLARAALDGKECYDVRLFLSDVDEEELGKWLMPKLAHH